MASAAETDFKTRLQHWIPKLVLSPSLVMVLVFVYGFILFTVFVSFTDSRILPFVDKDGQRTFDLIGLSNYEKLFRLSHWEIALTNMAVFAGLYIVVCTIIGLTLAILLDQKIRGEGFLRPLYLYPMALSFIVTGTAWKWFLDPGIGLENIVQTWGLTSFEFDWIKDRDFAIYTVVLAAVWQTSGFVMAMFLAGLRGIDNEILKAAQMDGASNWNLYRRIIIPQLRPAFLSAFVILAHLAIKTFDLVIAMTGGGPGRATELPATFMYSYTFSRNQMGIGASSAVIMLMTIAAIMIPYLYAELKEKK
ncbi:carbohydrate ABC transporter permease [uncultured Ruegeria sp.]|uniref:carbohydrate ABC transporter permease n=1 Tax=uncultured Ruegeria sp. TaxID=259304 RepID=UPI00261F7EF1|nr:sugar ABC transporter permease [uncultured Ruegeria sp.]